jgi:hypothetical protein
VQSTVHVRVGAADTGVTIGMAKKRTATMAALGQTILIFVSSDHGNRSNVCGIHGLDTETQLQSVTVGTGDVVADQL